MLDDVERRGFLEQPARKHPSPLLVTSQDDHLDKGAGQLVLFPRLGLVARAQLDDDIADANALPRFQLKIARQTIALVQKTERCDTVIHGGCRLDRHNPVWCRFFGNDGLDTRIGDGILDRRCGHRNDKQAKTAADQPAPVHALSGVHAS
jgi:hypothetical protein